MISFIRFVSDYEVRQYGHQASSIKRHLPILLSGSLPLVLSIDLCQTFANGKILHEREV